MTHKNPFMSRNTAGDHGEKSEKRVAKNLKARPTPASGATRGAKGDMTRPGFRIEAKATVHATMSLDLGWLVKIAEEALARGENPMLTVSFVMPDGKARNYGEWAIIPLYLAKEVFDAVPE